MAPVIGSAPAILPPDEADELIRLYGLLDGLHIPPERPLSTEETAAIAWSGQPGTIAGYETDKAIVKELWEKVCLRREEARGSAPWSDPPYGEEYRLHRARLAALEERHFPKVDPRTGRGITSPARLWRWIDERLIRLSRARHAIRAGFGTPHPYWDDLLRAVGHLHRLRVPGAPRPPYLQMSELESHDALVAIANDLVALEAGRISHVLSAPDYWSSVRRPDPQLTDEGANQGASGEQRSEGSASNGRRSTPKRDQGKGMECFFRFVAHVDAMKKGKTTKPPPSVSELAEQVGCDRSTASRATAVVRRTYEEACRRGGLKGWKAPDGSMDAWVDPEE
jgi:hypothetical protein